MATKHEGDLNLGCDALAEGNTYGGCHPLPSLSDLFVGTTTLSTPGDGPSSLCPMAIEEPPSSVRPMTRSSSDDLGILDANGSTTGGGGGCRWCVFVGCGGSSGGDAEKCSRKKTRRSIRESCYGNRLMFFGVLATLLFVATVVVAVVIYYCTVRSGPEIPIGFDVNGHELAVFGRGTIVPDVLRATLNMTTDGEDPLLRLFLVRSIEYKLLTLVKKTKFRDAYKGLQVIRLSLSDGTFEYSLAFRFVEDAEDFARSLRTEFARLTVDISSVEFSILQFDFASLQPSLPETTTNAESTEIPSETIFKPLCEAVHSSSSSSSSRRRTCYPNVLNHQTQEEATMDALANMQLYFSLCSDSMQLLWCSAFAPDCSTNGTPLPPCRSLCQAVVTDCPNLRADIENLLSGDCSSLPDISDSTCTDVRPVTPPTDSARGSSSKCRDVESEQCRALGFTSTSAAGNLLGQSTTASLHWLNLLLSVAENSRCSPDLLTFGCSVFFPKCQEDADDDSDQDDSSTKPRILEPCYDLCQDVKRDCGFFFSLVGMQFLSDFTCPTSHLSDTEHLSCSGAKVNADASGRQCREDQFQCDVSQCISANWICDGKKDCNNGKDEEDCATCQRETSFRCGNGQCIPPQRRCDGMVDCYSGDDEVDCLRVFTEMGIENLVQIYQPISRSWNTVCLPHAEVNKFIYSICNINRFSFFDNQGRGRGYNGSLVEYVRSRSNCSNHRPTVANCNYFDCIDGPLLDEATRLSDSSRFGGGTLTDGDWPWMVSLHGGRRKAFYCGGALVDAEWVLTAAHCVGSLTENDDWTIVAGQSRRTSTPSASRQERSVGRLVVHPRYASVKQDDIALVRLDRPVEFSRHVRRLCLPDARLPHYQPSEGQTCFVGGWGKTSYSADDDFSEELRLRRLSVETVTHCDDVLPSALADDGRSTVVCTSGRLADDVCKGDSGSAVLCEASEEEEEEDGAGNGNGNGRLVFAGIVSRGRECGHPNVSSVQTAVGPFTDWIRREISFSSSSSSSSSFSFVFL